MFGSSPVETDVWLWLGEAFGDSLLLREDLISQSMIYRLRPGRIREDEMDGVKLSHSS